ncbi:MAG: hypothetical protein JNN13_06160 [Planctomycetes bacterium]|nr:hypothetical protein [Planctomycetota bacterium]
MKLAPWLSPVLLTVAPALAQMPSNLELRLAEHVPADAWLEGGLSHLMPARIANDPDLDLVALTEDGQGTYNLVYFAGPFAHLAPVLLRQGVTGATVLRGEGPGGLDAIVAADASGLHWYEVTNDPQVPCCVATKGAAAFAGARELAATIGSDGDLLLVGIDAGGDAVLRMSRTGGAFGVCAEVMVLPGALEVLPLAFDGTGELELAVRYASAVAVHESTGAFWQHQFLAWFPFEAAGGRMVVSHDLAAGGRDLLVLHGRIFGSYHVLATNDVSSAFVGIGGFDARSITAADLDGDGRGDVALGGYQVVGGKVHPHLMVLHRAATPALFRATGDDVDYVPFCRDYGYLGAVAAADFDGDGDGDFVAHQRQGGANGTLHVLADKLAPAAQATLWGGGVGSDGEVFSVELEATIPPEVAAFVGPQQTLWLDLAGWLQESPTAPRETYACVMPLQQVAPGSLVQTTFVTSGGVVVTAQSDVLLQSRLCVKDANGTIVRWLPVRTYFASPDPAIVQAYVVEYVARGGVVPMNGTGGTGVLGGGDPSVGSYPPPRR